MFNRKQVSRPAKNSGQEPVASKSGRKRTFAIRIITRGAVIRLAVLAAVFAIFCLWAYFKMVKMPGESYTGKLPPLTGAQALLRDELVRDVDDRHQYGGWYVETLRDLRNLEPYIRKNDLLPQPYINIESVAAYTGPDGRFLQDYRQRRVTAQRLSPLFHNSPQRCLSLQAFILKEYAEAMWRFRRADTTMSGYVPFGFYSWFFDPFGNGENALREKPIW